MFIKKSLIVSLFLLAFCSFVTAQIAPQEKSATVFGAKIRYLEAGDATKPTVILLHGLGGNAENWQSNPLASNIAALAANYHVLAPDQIGFGKSDKASLVGNSMGGWVAGLMAIKYPNRVEKIVLADAAGIIPPSVNTDEIYQLNNSTRDEIRANLKRIFANPLLQNNEALVDQFMTARIAANDGYTINSLIESIKRKEDFLNDRLAEIKKPTLIIWGKQDGLLPVSDAAVFNKGIASSQVIIFENCGHAPQFEKAAEFNKAVLEFLGTK
jgi:2-hydroxy-6-oxonona-2,4-dienedioate hydrolase